MTEALQKMVAAMNAELERQSPVEILTLIETDGRHVPTIIIDMERLARVAAQALYDPTEEQKDVADRRVSWFDGDPVPVEDEHERDDEMLVVAIYRAMISSIYEPPPPRIVGHGEASDATPPESST